MKAKFTIAMALLIIALPAICQATLTEWTTGDYEIGFGDTYGAIRIINDVTLTINGGSISDLTTRNNTLTTMFGGTLGALIVYEESIVNLRGGSIESIVSQSDQAVHIYGLEFQWTPDEGNPLRGILTGSWEDGSQFSIDLRDCSPSTGEVVLHQIPEPISILLFGMGGLFLRKQK